MSNPDNSATQKEPNSSEASETETPSLEDQLATSEKRRKDTQAGYTKGQQANKAKDAVIAALTKQLEESTQIAVTPEQQAELDDLKFSDPVAWREKLNTIEDENLVKSRAKLTELSDEASGAAGREFELERREQVLKEFNASAKIVITDEVIANDVPPRISNKLVNNEITFDEYLVEVSIYLDKGKTIKNNDTLNQPNLGDIGGGRTPSDTKPEKTLSGNYKQDLY